MSMGTGIDHFGHVIDPVVGYARGEILRNSFEETLREARGQELLRARVQRVGAGGVYVFTGSPCDFPLTSGDLEVEAREALGPALFEERLRDRALQHMGGLPGDEVAVLNRTTGGIVATVLALAGPGDTVVSLVPGALSHPSVPRGVALAGADFVEVADLEAFPDALAQTRGSLAILTPVTSELQTLTGDDLVRGIGMARDAGRRTLVDDAYGARVRTVLLSQPAARAAGADLAITSNQKAGLTGPRAGILVGDPPLVRAVLAKAMEYGQEARGPMALAVLRTLEFYDPADVVGMAEAGRQLFDELASRYGRERVAATLLGPIIEADDLLAIALEAAGPEADPSIVPAEAGAALGMLLLEHHGIVTVNAVGSPGARVSLRLKCTAPELERAAGARRVADAVEDSFRRLAVLLEDREALRGVIVGER